MYGAGPSGYTCVKRQVTRHGSPSASRTAPSTVSWNAGKPLPGDRRLERVRQDAQPQQQVAQVGHADERLAPRADRSPAAARRLGRRVRRPPCSRQMRRPSREVGVDRMVGRLEAEHEHRVRPVARAGLQRLELVDQPAVRRVQAGLRERAHRLGAARGTSAKRTAREARCSGRGCTRTHASVITPSVPSEPSSIRSGEGPAPEPGRRRDCPRAGRRDRADALDEVVDVGELRREVPARARRDPAAERRELERLREEAHRQAVRAEQLLDARPGSRRRRCAPRARPRRARAAPSSAPRSSDSAPSKRAGMRGSTPPTTLVPPPYGTTATFAPAAHSSSAATSRLVARARDDVRDVLVDAAERADGVEVRLAVGVRRALAVILRADGRERAGRRRDARLRAASPRSSGTGSSSSPAGKPSSAGMPGRRLERLRRGERRVLEAPAPGAARARHRPDPIGGR